MANTHTLRLVDGSGTINLSGSWAEYVPMSPEINAVEYVPAGLYNGGERPEVTRRNVEETCQIWVDDTTAAAVQGTIRTIEKYFLEAEHYQRTRMGAPVYVEFDPGESGTVYRSELLGGRVELDSGALKIGQWSGLRVGAGLQWTRRWYWEGPEAALTVYNRHGTSTAGTIYSHVDIGNDNWLAIDGTAVSGSLPAPVKFTLTNPGAGTAISDIHIAHNVWSNPGSINCTVELEDTAVTGTTITDSISSSGRYQVVNVGTAYSQLYCLLSAGTLDAYAGNWVIPQIRFLTPVSGGPGTMTMYTKLMYADSALFPMNTGPEVTFPLSSTWGVEHLGAFRLPMGIPTGTSGYRPARLYLYWKGVTAGTIGLDTLNLAPADSYRVLHPAVDSMGTATITVDDMIADRIYNTDTGLVNLTGHIIGIGGPIELWPGKNQRLYFNCESVTPLAPLRVSVSYRPRRLTL